MEIEFSGKTSFRGDIMWKPIIVLTILMSLVGFASIAVQRCYIHVAVAGYPFDWLGNGINCHKCGTLGVEAGSGYSYKCPHCRAEYRARRGADGKVEIDW